MNMQIVWPMKDATYSTIIGPTRQRAPAIGATSPSRQSTHVTRSRSSKTPQKELRLNFKQQSNDHDSAKRTNTVTPISNGAAATSKKQLLSPEMMFDSSLRAAQDMIDWNITYITVFRSHSPPFAPARITTLILGTRHISYICSHDNLSMDELYTISSQHVSTLIRHTIAKGYKTSMLNGTKHGTDNSPQMTNYDTADSGASSTSLNPTTGQTLHSATPHLYDS